MTEQKQLSASEAVFGLLGWLTSRRESVTFGSVHDAGVAAELAQVFIDTNGLDEPRAGWADLLTHPPEPVAPTTTD